MYISKTNNPAQEESREWSHDGIDYSLTTGVSNNRFFAYAYAPPFETGIVYGNTRNAARKALRDGIRNGTLSSSRCH